MPGEGRTVLDKFCKCTSDEAGGGAAADDGGVFFSSVVW